MKTNHQKPEEEAWRQAVYWLKRAERYCSPAEFRIAADFYERAGKTVEADRCRERAEFYARMK